MDASLRSRAEPRPLRGVRTARRGEALALGLLTKAFFEWSGQSELQGHRFISENVSHSSILSVPS
jgi:hypothetical protein